MSHGNGHDAAPLEGQAGARVRGATVYPPGGKPITFAGGTVIAFDFGSMLLVVKLEGEEQRGYQGVPFSVDYVPSAVLTAPASSLIVPGGRA